MLPDCASFLRFHRPEKFGDDLSPARYSIKLANEEKITAQGFEIGSSYHGYRYIFPLFYENLHIGPSDYVPWLKDNKICFIRIEGRKFGNIPIELELRLSVEDSPNSAGCVIDAIRLLKLALNRKIGGPLISASSYLMKSPPV